MTGYDADAIVVGAGPAGSAAAIALARAGRAVLLLDRAAFPREKPCGDLLGVRAMRLARQLGVSEATFAPYQRMRGAMILAGGRELDLAPRTRAGRACLATADARVIPRRVFDAALVDAAREAGATLHRVDAREVTPYADGRIVRGRGDDGAVELRARAVILAGGYGCRLGMASSPSPSMESRESRDEPARGIAYRGYWRRVGGPPNQIMFCLDDWLLPGYGWIFPLPDGGANVGVGCLVPADGARVDLAAMYDRFTTDPASPASPWLSGAEAVGAARTRPLDLGPRRRPVIADGLLAAGEAAALVGPLTGAGIASALASGERAGTLLAAALPDGDVLAARLTPYADYVRRQLRPRLRVEWAAQRWLADPAHLAGLVRAAAPLAPTGVLGARLLLHLG